MIRRTGGGALAAARPVARLGARVLAVAAAAAIAGAPSACTGDGDAGGADAAAGDARTDAAGDVAGESGGFDGPTATIALPVLRDRIEGGWVGQIVGVTAAGVTEFLYLGEIIPEENVPEWSPFMFETGWLQDDLYVEVPFLEAFLAHGPYVGFRELGDAFAASKFPLWHANGAARDNLRKGVRAPGSGHWRNNPHADDIDWQIESDFIGLAAPGMVSEAIDMAWRAGHVVNFGDGVYGGVWVAAMHAEAFVAKDLSDVIEAGRRSVPEGSLFRRVIEDAIAAHAAHPDDWTAAWREIQDRWGNADRCPDGAGVPYNIDAKLNAAYVLIGLLYGDGDLDESIRIAMRCGQDSDCNASTVGGILGTLYGLSAMPGRYREAVDWERTFTYTERSLRDCVDATLAVAREVLRLAGGHVAGEGDLEVWTVPRRPVVAPILAQWPAGADAEGPAIDARVASVDGLTATLQASATDPDGVAALQWSFGDGGFASGGTVAHEYPGPGTYRAVAWASDTLGDLSSKAIDVVIAGQ